MAPERSPQEIAEFITKTCKRIVMNEQQPYEKYLAEKLKHLPLPDVEPNWQQMKSLLDKRMPRGGAYWKWFTGVGIIIILLFGGTWVITSQNEPVTASNRPGATTPGLSKQNETP